MRRLIAWLTLLFFVACTTTTGETASDNGTVEHMADNHMGGDDQSEGSRQHIHAAVPDEYADLTNPVAGDETAVAAGKTTFETFCATCHGVEGQGDGPAAEALSPKPADLSDGMMMMDLDDAYLFWRISEGGAMEPFNSAMPAWKTSLPEEQIWQVVSYVRTLSER